MRDWTPEEIAFMHDAESMSDYYEKIAAQIRPFLPAEAHLCDAGCGLGYLGMALLPCCRAVTCVDCSPSAMEDLRRRAPEGMKTLCGDVQSLPPQRPYDAMVFCLFGSTAQALSIAQQQCRGRIFLVKREYTHHRFSAGNIPLGGYTAMHSRGDLERYDIPYEAVSFTAEFGQPFRSMAEAERFFAIYNRSAEEKLTAEEIRHRLVPGPSEEFPYYLPNERHLCLLVLDTEDVIRRSERWKNDIS